MLLQCWTIVYDTGPTLIQHWANEWYLLGILIIPPYVVVDHFRKVKVVRLSAWDVPFDNPPPPPPASPFSHHVVTVHHIELTARAS